MSNSITKCPVSLSDFGFTERDRVAAENAIKHANRANVPIKIGTDTYWVSKLPPVDCKGSATIGSTTIGPGSYYCHETLKESTTEELLKKLNSDNTKQPRYKNNAGSKDLIDHWAEVKSDVEFRAIMIAQIEKYCRRYGKKDDVLKEITKIQDYATRLKQYEETKTKGGN